MDKLQQKKNTLKKMSQSAIHGGLWEDFTKIF
jgi:hypothetical protein